MFAVVQFPGSNDDRDMRFAFKSILGAEARLVWHRDEELPPGTEGVLLPGGFSYGDYLRTGAMARFYPLIDEVIKSMSRLSCSARRRALKWRFSAIVPATCTSRRPVPG